MAEESLENDFIDFPSPACSLARDKNFKIPMGKTAQLKHPQKKLNFFTRSIQNVQASSCTQKCYNLDENASPLSSGLDHMRISFPLLGKEGEDSLKNGTLQNESDA